MPRHPELAAIVSRLQGSVFSALADRLAGPFDELYPLHLGDTYLAPIAGARLEDFSVAAHPGLHNYSPPRGRRELIDLLVERTRERTGQPIERGNVYITAGATAGLSAAVFALAGPGDEVLILAPHWPLIAGIVRASGARAVTVPVIDGPSVVSSEVAIERLERATTAATVALYLSSPNNPTGRVLPPEFLAALVEWAGRRNLWLISDEVYEDFVYRGEHQACYALAPERTVVSHSFSKAYGMAGNRCGWLIGPEVVLAAAEKVGSHSFYSTATGAQFAAARALRGGDSWLADANQRYREAGFETAAILGIDPPEGGSFLFLDLGEALDERGLAGFLEDCSERGLFLAPGPSFGDYPTWARLCFTAVPPDATARGARLLREMIDRRVAPKSPATRYQGTP
jgi:N-succinyldiaminopimelate aminotransferase